MTLFNECRPGRRALCLNQRRDGRRHCDGPLSRSHDALSSARSQQRGYSVSPTQALDASSSTNGLRAREGSTSCLTLCGHALAQSILRVPNPHLSPSSFYPPASRTMDVCSLYLETRLAALPCQSCDAPLAPACPTGHSLVMALQTSAPLARPPRESSSTSRAASSSSSTSSRPPRPRPSGFTSSSPTPCAALSRPTRRPSSRLSRIGAHPPWMLV